MTLVLSPVHDCRDPVPMPHRLPCSRRGTSFRPPTALPPPRVNYAARRPGDRVRPRAGSHWQGNPGRLASRRALGCRAPVEPGCLPWQLDRGGLGDFWSALRLLGHMATGNHTRTTIVTFLMVFLIKKRRTVTIQVNRMNSNEGRAKAVLEARKASEDANTS